MTAPKTLTVKQEESLLENLSIEQGTHKQKAKGVRNTSIAIVFLETGIRVAELCGLRIDDLWYAEQPVENLIVQPDIAKNGKERQIPISRKLAETINQMHAMLWSPSNAGKSDFVFYANCPMRPLSTRQVERIILKAAIAGFNTIVTPHMLRHTFASRMMRKTNSRVVQELLGHDSLQTTQIYMHPNSDDLKNAINGD